MRRLLKHVGESDDLHVDARQDRDVARLSREAPAWRKEGVPSDFPVKMVRPIQNRRRTQTATRTHLTAAYDSSSASRTEMPNGSVSRTWRDCESRTSSMTCRAGCTNTRLSGPMAIYKQDADVQPGSGGFWRSAAASLAKGNKGFRAS